MQKTKRLSDGILKTSEADREVKDKGKKEKKSIYIYPTECRISENSKER